MNKKNEEIGKLLWEKQLFELDGNTVAVDRIEKIIKRIREKEETDESTRVGTTSKSV